MKEIDQEKALRENDVVLKLFGWMCYKDWNGYSWYYCEKMNQRSREFPLFAILNPDPMQKVYRLFTQAAPRPSSFPPPPIMSQNSYVLEPIGSSSYSSSSSCSCCSSAAPRPSSFPPPPIRSSSSISEPPPLAVQQSSHEPPSRPPPTPPPPPHRRTSVSPLQLPMVLHPALANDYTWHRSVSWAGVPFLRTRSEFITQIMNGQRLAWALQSLWNVLFHADNTGCNCFTSVVMQRFDYGHVCVNYTATESHVDFELACRCCWSYA